MLEIINKGKILKAILEIEIIAYKIGLHSVDLYRFLAEKVGKNTSYQRKLKEIIKELEKGKPKSSVYSKYLPSELLEMVKRAEEKGYALGDFFEVYTIASRDIDWGRGKMKGAITKPVIMFFIVSVISIYSLNKILNISRDVGIGDTDTIKLLLNLDIFFMFFIPIVLILLLVKYPYKTPILKRIYNEIDGYKFLSIINLMLKNGFSTSDIEAFFKKIYPNKKLNKLQGLKYLSSFLEKKLSEVEYSVLYIAITSSQYDKVIPKLVEVKREGFKDRIVMVSSSLEEILIFMSAIPIALMISGIVSFMIGIMSKF